MTFSDSFRTPEGRRPIILRIRQLRAEQSLTQGALAQKIGVKKRHIQNLEGNRASFTTRRGQELLQKIAVALGDPDLTNVVKARHHAHRPALPIPLEAVVPESGLVIRGERVEVRLSVEALRVLAENPAALSIFFDQIQSGGLLPATHADFPGDADRAPPGHLLASLKGR